MMIRNIIENLLKYISISIIVSLMNCNKYGVYDVLLHPQSYNVFVSSVSTKGDMSDFRAAFPVCDLASAVETADCACNTLATSAALHSKGGTKFRTGLSTTTTSMSWHIIKLTGWTVYSVDLQNPASETSHYCDTEPSASAVLSTWQNNGEILDSWDGLTTYARGPVTMFTDTGQQYTGDIWTGGKDQNCLDWTSAAGTDAATTATSGGFFPELPQSCDLALPVYCFEYEE